jgi:hypothetical protein
MSTTRHRTISAVKLDDEGWLGVSVDAGRCHGHAHETPELAKLCALHREQEVRLPEGNVLLLPLPAAPAERKSVARG